MSNSSVRIAIVGSGSRGRSHIAEVYRINAQEHVGRAADDGEMRSPQPLYETYADDKPEWVDDISELRPDVTAIYDPSESSRRAAEATCRDHGGDPVLFDSYDAFLESDAYDAVIVASPNDTHVDVATPLLERNVDVLCEKPLATTLEGYDELDERVARSDGLFYTAFNMRSRPYYRKLKALVDADAIGELGMISCREVRTPFPDGHYYSQAASGGSILEKNCHDFDLMNWITDADPKRVAAFGGQHVFTKNTDVNDHAVVIVEYGNGVRASLDLCLYAPYGVRFSEFTGHRDYELRGTEGVLKGVPDGRHTWELFTRWRREQFEGDQFPGGHGGSDYLQMLRFLRCLRGEETPPASPIDAKKAAAIAIGAEVSIQNGTFVEIDSNYDLQ